MLFFRHRQDSAGCIPHTTLRSGFFSCAFPYFFAHSLRVLSLFLFRISMLRHLYITDRTESSGRWKKHRTHLSAVWHCGLIDIKRMIWTRTDENHSGNRARIRFLSRRRCFLMKRLRMPHTTFCQNRLFRYRSAPVSRLR